MELRSANQVSHTHEVPAMSLPTERGFRPIRQLARVQMTTVDIRWIAADSATMAAVRDHWNRYGRLGIPFTYGPPGAVLADGVYTYDTELQVTRNGAREVAMSVRVTQSLAYD